MKTLIFILALAAIALTGCYSQREIQVEMVSAQLIRIDTVYRYAGSDQERQLLTWRDNNNMQYVSYAPMQTSYFVGTRMAVLRTR